MRQHGGIQLQDPSASPTFALSRPAPSTNTDVPSSLRRNLFGSHLSRRPAQVPNASTDRMPDPFRTMSTAPQQPQPHIYQGPSQHEQDATYTNPTIYEPRSPARSLSPLKSQPYTSTSSSIIALDPTGRPQLPVMPQLPARMPEGSEEDEEEDDLDDEDDPDDDDDHAMAWRRVKAYERANAAQHELEAHSSSIIGGLSTQQSRLHDLLDSSTSRGDYRDYEKIEGILHEMQSQQRARARTIPESSSSSLETPIEGGGVSARTRGKARATTRNQVDQFKISKSEGLSRTGGVGATLDPADKDELLSLIMTSLARRVQEADEDAWMFGDERAVANGVSVSGSFNVAARDEFGVES